jgi:hypothetical protein
LSPRGTSVVRATIITVDAQQLIVPELEPGESLLWSGQPKEGSVARRRTVIR